MFKLTRQEQLIVAFLFGAIVLGTVVKEWRARNAEAARAAQSETRSH